MDKLRKDVTICIIHMQQVSKSSVNDIKATKNAKKKPYSFKLWDICRFYSFLL